MALYIQLREDLNEGGRAYILITSHITFLMSLGSLFRTNIITTLHTVADRPIATAPEAPAARDRTRTSRPPNVNNMALFGHLLLDVESVFGRCIVADSWSKVHDVSLSSLLRIGSCRPKLFQRLCAIGRPKLGCYVSHMCRLTIAMPYSQSVYLRDYSPTSCFSSNSVNQCHVRPSLATCRHRHYRPSWFH